MDEKRLIKSYRIIQQWDRWLTQPLGQRLLATETSILSSLLAGCTGEHAVLIGVPEQLSLFAATIGFSHRILVSPLIHKNKTIYYVEGEFKQLPIASASVNVVILPHTLECFDNPYAVMQEACRIVKPEGHIIILGFNAHSLWGLKKTLEHNHHLPWSLNFIAQNKIKKWLLLADFQLINQKTCFFRPPLQQHNKLYENLKWVEWIGSLCWPCWGGVYILMAKAKVIPLTPMKLHWQQALTGTSVSIAGHPLRNLS